MISYTTASSLEDLRGILALQKANLANNISVEEASSEGFVTAIHTLEILQKMNAIEQSIIAKEDDKVIAYLLAMTPECRFDITALVSLFEQFDKIKWKDKLLSSYHYLVVGQVCVAMGYRGQGILDNCYQAYKNHFKGKYDFAITDIVVKNQRSINAHKRIGFTEVSRFVGPDNQEWSIVLWDW